MLKKIFISLLLVLILTSFSWAGVYKAKLTFDLGDGHPDNFIFDLEEIQNDLGLDIEKRLFYTHDHHDIAYVAAFLFIRNSDFSIHFKNYNVVEYFRNPDGSIIQEFLKSRMLLLDLKNGITEITIDPSMKEIADNAFYISKAPVKSHKPRVCFITLVDPE